MKVILILLALFFFYTAAHAAPVTFSFTGSIDGVPLSGSYTFNSGGTEPNARFGQTRPTDLFIHSDSFFGRPNAYGDVITAATVNWTEHGALLNEPFVPMGPRNGIALANYAPGNSCCYDYYAVTIPLAGDGIGGYTYFGFSITDETFTMLSDMTLPSQPPSVNLATTARVGLYNRETGALAYGPLTSLVHTPLPASVVLFVGGLIFIAVGTWSVRMRLQQPVS